MTTGQTLRQQKPAVIVDTGGEAAVGTRTVCGYLKKRFMMTSGQVSELRQMIVDCASDNELMVDKIFEDQADVSSDQLSECLAALLGADEPIMIVPDLSHFAGYGNPIETRQILEREGIKVLSARHRQSDAGTGDPGEVETR